MKMSELVNSYNSVDDDNFILESYIYEYEQKLFSEKKLSNKTITQIILDLHRFDRFLKVTYPKLENVKELKYMHINYYLQFCINGLMLKNKTFNKKLRAIRKLLNYLTLNKHILDYNPALKVSYLKNELERPLKHIPKNVINIIFAELSNSKYGVRDITISKFLLYTGLQLQEIMNLQINNLDLKNKKIHLLRDNEKYTFKLAAPLYKSLKEYMSLRKVLSSNKEFTNYLFISNTGKPYDSRLYQYQFKNAIIRSNIQSNYTPKHLKFSFAYYMAKKTDQDTLKKILNQDKVEHYYDLDENPFLS
ncbi:tyrosine-type recombinase/integrase [Senegalia massiliensis]|uniref:Uncharacterized protein n=1 Tax=Senegalia massiliensis TaxID=1720316 RepID=A0A845QXC5_9CLOT|nr:tyrosine-type recombinase/integrase [Senegalia massiliensis]NBI07607.1 hypothetical protein [Senegalia massiliensis]